MTEFLFDATEEERLLQWRGAGDRLHWKRGAEMLASLEKYVGQRRDGRRVTKKAVYAAAVRLVGARPSLLREEVETEIAFHVTMLQRSPKYQTLTWNYFSALRFPKKFTDQDRVRWLDWAVESADEHGGLPTPIGLFELQISTGGPDKPRPGKLVTFPVWSADSDTFRRWLADNPTGRLVIVDGLAECEHVELRPTE